MAGATLRTKLRSKMATMRGTFQRMSLLKTAPQFQQARSAVGVNRPHLRQGRRGAEGFLPHRTQMYGPESSGARQ
jgi:hypothetical protein